MNKTIIVLLKAILGLWVTRLPKHESSKDEFLSLIDKYLSTVKTLTTALGLGSESEVINNLKETIDWLKFNTHEIAYVELVARVKLDLGDYGSYIEAFADFAELEPAILLNHARYELLSVTDMADLKKEINNASRALNNKSENNLNLVDFIKSHIDSIEKYKNKFTNTENLVEGGVGSINPDSIEKALEAGIKEHDNTFKLLSPYKGLNEMLGGGMPFPTYINVAALTGNYKTGSLLDFYIGAALFNKPRLDDPNKKPLLLRITLETSLNNDIMQLYKRVYALEHGTVKKPKEINVAEATEYVKNIFQRNGWEFDIRYFEPAKCDVNTIKSLVEAYEQAGYEVKVLNLDYAFLLVESSSDLTYEAELVVEDLRGFCFTRNCIFMSAHQFNGSIKNEKSALGAKFVETILPTGQFMRCKSLDTKMDISIGCDIFKHKGKSYLVFACSKNRHLEVILKSYCIYEFDPVKGLPMDALDETPKYIGSYSDLQRILNEEAAKEFGEEY